MKEKFKEVKEMYKSLDENQKDNLLIIVLVWAFIITLLFPTLFGRGKKVYKKELVSVEEIDYQHFIDSITRYSMDDYEVDQETMTLWNNSGKKINVTVTVYNPVKSQCDSDPLITANNSKIDLKKLNAGKLKWVAVSRDLLRNGVSYGDKIRLTSKENPKINGEYFVMDCMNKRFTKRVDLLVPENIKLGLWKDVEMELLN